MAEPEGEGPKPVQSTDPAKGPPPAAADLSRSGGSSGSLGSPGSSGPSAGDAEAEVVVVDGSNVAYAVEGAGARLANILAVCGKLESEGYRPVVLVDARLRHTIDDRGGYEALVEAGRIRQAPAGTDADYFILSFARELGARVVSNDRFRSREEAFPEVTETVIRFMVLDGEVVLERRTRSRTD